MSSPESNSKPHHNCHRHHHRHSPARHSGSIDAIVPQMEREKNQKQPLPDPLLPDKSSASTVPSQDPPKSPEPQSRNLMVESACHAMSVHGSPESQYPSKATTSGRTPTSGPDLMARSRLTRRANDIKNLSWVEKATGISAGLFGAVYVDPELLAEGANEFDRERLCIKVGEALGEDRTLVTIWEMGDIEYKDAAMIERVKDLVSSLPSPNESHCTD